MLNFNLQNERIHKLEGGSKVLLFCLTFSKWLKLLPEPVQVLLKVIHTIHQACGHTTS